MAEGGIGMGLDSTDASRFIRFDFLRLHNYAKLL